MMTSSDLESSPSLAVSRSAYVPAIEKFAEELSAVALLNVTVPGPLTLLHDLVSVLPVGRPSSVADPASVTPFGNVTVESGPALTTGATFVGTTGLTVITTSSEAVNVPSLAVSLNVYVPAVWIAAEEFKELALTKTTVPGPLILVQAKEIVLPDGNPSSVAVPDNVGPAGSVIV